MRLLFTLFALACLACLAPAAETVVTTSGESFTKAADGKFYPTALVAPDGSVKGATAGNKGCVCGDDCKCPAGVCPQRCPTNVPTPMPRPGFLPQTCPDGKCPMPLPGGVTRPQATGPAVPASLLNAPKDTTRLNSCVGEDALAEVNFKRAARGLPPYKHDPALSEAAHRCAAFRAARLIFGHCPGAMGDFAFLQGAPGKAAGCAAYPDGYGFMACAMYDHYQYAGAAWVRGSDGKRYCHLWLR